FDTGNRATTLSGAISGLGISLNKIGASTLTLSGASSYSGTTNLNAGTLILSNNVGLGSSTLAMADGTTLRSALGGLSLANATGLDNANGHTTTLAGDSRRSGGLAKTGAGTLMLSGNSDYSGTTSLNAGILALSNSDALGSSTLAMANGTTLRSALGGLSLAN